LTFSFKFGKREPVKKQNIVLVGFRGAGKTTIGRALAKVSGLPFADLDEEVEFVLGESIVDFVEKHGWQVFREVEQKVTHDFCRNFSGILATGGGTIENSKNLQNLKKTGTFVFVNPNFSKVKKFLMQDKSGKRPQLNPSVPFSQEIDMLWAQRKDIYSATADIEINQEYDGDMEATAKSLLEGVLKSHLPALSPKKRVAIFSSTRGTTFQGLLDRQAFGRIPNVEFVLFVTNKPDCEALEKAKKAGISNIEVLGEDDNLSREEYDRALINIVRSHNPDIILLAGWMRVLSALYCDQFGDISLNVHPSLLPKFAGLMNLEIHKKVLEYEEKYAGCTVHRTSAEVDEGEQVLQRKVLVDENDTPDTLQQKVQKQEVLAFCEVLEKR